MLASVKQLVFVFCDILPDYKIREDMDTERDGHVMLSKNVKRMRKMEQFLLESYRKYLQILETFTKFKPVNFSKSTMEKYEKLKIQAFHCYILCLERLNHFNYIKNIIKIICARLSSKVAQINKLCTKSIFNLMENRANHTQELKLFTVQEIAKQLKSRPHLLFQNNILECLGLHNIIIK